MFSFWPFKKKEKTKGYNHNPGGKNTANRLANTTSTKSTEDDSPVDFIYGVMGAPIPTPRGMAGYAIHGSENINSDTDSNRRESDHESRSHSYTETRNHYTSHDTGSYTTSYDSSTSSDSGSSCSSTSCD